MKRVPPKISTRIEKNLVQSVPDTILSATMSRKQCFWLLALVAAVLILNSCGNEQGLPPAGGEMSRSHGGSRNGACLLLSVPLKGRPRAADRRQENKNQTSQ